MARAAAPAPYTVLGSALVVTGVLVLLQSTVTLHSFTRFFSGRSSKTKRLRARMAFQGGISLSYHGAALVLQGQIYRHNAEPLHADGTLELVHWIAALAMGFHLSYCWVVNSQAVLRARGISSGTHVSVNYDCISAKLRRVFVALALYSCTCLALRLAGVVKGLALPIQLAVLQIAPAQLLPCLLFYRYHWPLRKSLHMLPPAQAARLSRRLKGHVRSVRIVAAGIAVQLLGLVTMTHSAAPFGAFNLALGVIAIAVHAVSVRLLHANKYKASRSHSSFGLASQTASKAAVRSQAVVAGSSSTTSTANVTAATSTVVKADRESE